MLEHSRGGSGERRSVDLNALIEEALNLAYHGARAQDQSFNITLERDFADGIAPIELVPQDITRVFLNLFGNGFYAATKRQKEGGDPEFQPTLKVSTRDLGDAVEIRIRDNGTGIPPEIRDKLFQPFFTTKPTGEGTGLGLSISYDIVTQQHGGTIEVDSRVGEFTEFTIHCPAPAKQRQQRRPRHKRQHHYRRIRRIDCVDIDISVLTTMAQILIRNLYTAVIEALRRRAAVNGTSTEEQAVAPFQRRLVWIARRRFPGWSRSAVRSAASKRRRRSKIFVATGIGTRDDGHRRCQHRTQMGHRRGRV